MIDEHKHILTELDIMYPDESEEVFKKLLKMVDTFKASYQPKTTVLTEEDVVLICYADHVHEKGKKTLLTMKLFLDSFANNLVNTIHFLPFCPYSSDDGFSVIDYQKINPAFGDWKDITAMEEHFKLMFDLVINHISKKHMWFTEFLKGNPKYNDYFIHFPNEIETASVFRPRTHPLLTPFETKTGKEFLWTTFSDDQIDLNFQSTSVMLAIIDVYLSYIKHGARIIRLDAIAYLWKKLGTSCIHLPETHAFVRLLRAITTYAAPDVKIITETNVPHKDNISYFGNGTNEAHLVYNFTLPPLLLYTFMKGNAKKLSTWAKTLQPPHLQTSFFNFTASHDGIGLTPLKGIISPKEIEELAQHVLAKNGNVNYRSVPGKIPEAYELNIVYLDAIGSKEAFLASQAIALSLQGVPGIYFNNLIGAENDLIGLKEKKYNRAINREKFELEKLERELTTKGTTKEFVYSHYKALLTARKKESAFSPEATQEILDCGEFCFGIVRENISTNDNIIALVNTTHKQITIQGKMISEHLDSNSAKDIITEKKIPLDKLITLKPFEYLWLKK